MTTITLTQPPERIQLSGISWPTYEALLAELSNRRIRLTYNRGALEIMVPSPEHELYKEIVGRFVETLAEELEIRIYPLGSTTFKRSELSGAEPDKCFYIQNLNAVKGKNRIDLNQDPPPDLVVEIDITSSSRIRFPVYAELGVPEVWVYDGESFSINVLRDKEYVPSERSLAFPNVPVLEISRFLQQAGTADYLELVRAFRSWVKSQIQPNP
ncbi:MAG: Uma2 family endonuclease [Oscillatoria princeps RMCB-10]|jgi:Uma2 family endonuclease|nr:Uma2 family endonuclease [Oscillatoria princeps RMCB-10]